MGGEVSDAPRVPRSPFSVTLVGRASVRLAALFPAAAGFLAADGFDGGVV
jgi:hypothetical protein